MSLTKAAKIAISEVLIAVGTKLHPWKNDKQQDALRRRQHQGGIETHDEESTPYLLMLDKHVRSFIKQNAAHHRANKASGDNVLRWSKCATVLTAITTVFSFGAVVVAVRQAQIFSDTEQRQLRAYMFRSSTDFTMPPNPIPKEGVYVSVGVTFKDGGETPAYETKIKAWIAPLTEPFVPKELFDIVNSRAALKGINNSSVFFKDDPIGMTITSATKYSPLLVDAIRAGDHVRLYAFGEVTWLDTFKNPHWLHFCYIFGGSENAANTSHTEQFRYCSVYNGAD